MKAISRVADPPTGGQTGAIALGAAVVVVEFVVAAFGAELVEELPFETKYTAITAMTTPIAI